jgi:hypothetical protein
MTASRKEFNNGLKKAKNWDGKSRVSNDAYGIVSLVKRKVMS